MKSFLSIIYIEFIKMAKLIPLFAILLYFALSNVNCEDLDCSYAYTCALLKPEMFWSRGFNFHCNPKNENVCNKYPFKNCNPCVYQEYLCNKFFVCDGSRVKIEGTIFDCPTNYECNNKGEDRDCPTCLRIKCTEPKNWKCLDEMTAEINGTTINCVELEEMCNENHVAPCGKPCVNRYPDYDTTDMLQKATDL